MTSKTTRPAVLAALLLLVAAGVASAEEGLLARLEKEVRTLAGRARPAVVKVTARPTTAFFGEDVPNVVQALLERSSPVGTGFLVSEEGLVVTTHRIARGADTARVEFPSGLVREGTVIGADSFYQVALLRVDPVASVSPLELAEKEELEGASLGVFLGNSFGSVPNVSLGVVSRSPKLPDLPLEYDNYLVMNAPLHPGDEGGPLVGPAGEVVAVGAGRYSGAVSVTAGGEGTRVRVRTFGGSGGMGLLLPASDVRFAIGEIEMYGRVRHGKLGVYLKPGTLEVRDVQPGSPAAEAGLAAGDVIVGMGDRPVTTDTEFRFRLRRTPIDAEVELRVERDGGEVVVRSGLADREEPRTVEVLPGVQVLADGPPVVVVVVGRGDPRPGDRILSVNGRKVTTAVDAARALRLLGEPDVVLGIQRGDQRLTLELNR